MRKETLIALGLTEEQAETVRDLSFKEHAKHRNDFRRKKSIENKARAITGIIELLKSEESYDSVLNTAFECYRKESEAASIEN